MSNGSSDLKELHAALKVESEVARARTVVHSWEEANALVDRAMLWSQTMKMSLPDAVSAMIRAYAAIGPTPERCLCWLCRIGRWLTGRHD